MSNISASLVPRLLRTQLNIFRYLLSRYENDPGDCIQRAVTQDEAWVHHFNSESKVQSKQWKRPGSPPLKTFKRVHSAGNVIILIFWGSQEVIMTAYLEQGRTINDAYYAGELRRLRWEIARKWRGKLPYGILLLHDNALDNTSQVAMINATECGFEILPHPPILLI